ncbi:MAG TPA: hypothetical protein VFS17_08150, partial [Methylophilaceae bacterium]|nr:hypothetical protein [Methylophilaceae bacterium]
QGLQYSRFVDDITVSSSRHLNNSEKSQVISAVFSMLHSKGYSPKREKHEIQTQGSRILVTKLVTNDKVSLTRQQRSNLRAALYQLENRIQKGERGLEIAAQVNSLGAKVGQLNRFHKRQGSELRKRLRMLREVLRACPIQNTTYPTEEIESYSGPEMPF